MSRALHQRSILIRALRTSIKQSEQQVKSVHSDSGDPRLLVDNANKENTCT